MFAMTRLCDAIEASFRCVQRSESPFPHAVSERVLDDVTANSLLDWFRDRAPWGLETSSFYIQHGCSLDDKCDSEVVDLLCCRDVIEQLSKHVGLVFDTVFDAPKTSVSAHRLIPGHRIGIHNDCPRNGTETHRLIVHLNDDVGEESGGALALFDREDPANSLVVIPPQHNLGVMLEFSTRSWHTVDEVKDGVRYSLLYSLWVSHGGDWAGETLEGTTSPQLFDDLYARAIALLVSLPFAGEAHSGGTFAKHLAGTGRILKEWHAEKDVCLAGLFHNILGTPSVAPPSVSREDMANIRHLIGERPLWLIKLYSRLTMHDLKTTCTTRMVHVDHGTLKLQAGDITGLLLLHLANLLEQSAYYPLTADERWELSQCLDSCAAYLHRGVIQDIRRTYL
jgi:hypothetical protein